MGVKTGNIHREQFGNIHQNQHKSQIPIPFDLGFSFLGINPTHLLILLGEMEMCRLFFAALLVLAKDWKQSKCQQGIG